jgi:hypothetical protein
MKGKPVVLLALCIGASGCEVLAPSCTDDLSQRVEPATATITVGEQLKPAAQFYGCRGSRRLSDVITWSSADPDIASVDASTGIITGRTTGSTRITPHGEKYGSILSIGITVR